MARKPRIHFKAAVYHIVLQGQGRDSIFRSVADRREWEALVADGCARFQHKVLAYCWMNTQVNMVVQVSDAPLSRIMQNLSFRYTRAFNKRHELDGPIFRGRYKAILIDPDAYLTELVRFVHNLPVQEGKAKKPADFRWSSHAAYLSGEGPDFLNTDIVLGRFGKSERAARTAYRKYIESAAPTAEPKELMRGNEGGRLLGDAKFKKKALRTRVSKAGSVPLSRIVRYVCQQENVKEAELKNEGRGRFASQLRQLITCIAMDLEAATLTDMARRYNRDLTTMSRNQRYFREKLAADTLQQRKLKAYKTALLKP